MIVVDANIAAKWYLNEPGCDEAAAILNSDAPLLAPALIRIEVTGAIVRCYRDQRLSLKRAKEACEQWDANLAAGGVKLMSDEVLFETARTIAFQIRHAIQDCLYLAAALSVEGARLVTADRTFHTRASPAFPFVELLAAARIQ